MIGLIFACLMATEYNNEPTKDYSDFEECEYSLDSQGNYIDGTSVAIEDNDQVDGNSVATDKENNLQVSDTCYPDTEKNNRKLLTEFKHCEICGGLIDEESGEHIGCGGVKVENIEH